MKTTDQVRDYIRESREIGLGLLKPSACDLEHGLELHAESVICDAYGFSPRAALDSEALNALVEAGASAVEFREAQEEMIMTRCLTDAGQRAEFQAAWEAAGVTCLFQNAGTEDRPPLAMLKRLAHYTLVTDLLDGFIEKAVTPGAIPAAKAAGRRCLYLTCNGLPLPGRLVSVAEELSLLKIFFELGCRMMHLTYNRRNLLGDGCGESADAGLSDFGRQAIAEMNRAGLIVDVAHSGQRTSLEAARASARPAVASHSVCAGLNDHIRGKGDDVVRALADSGGYIGICGVPQFLGGRGDITAFLDHIDYAVGRFGDDHVAIGTDRAYHLGPSQSERARLGPVPAGSNNWQSLWPAGSLPYRPDWQKPEQLRSLEWTNWPLFTVGLVQRGHSDERIRKIIGLNVLRVARANFPYDRYPGLAVPETGAAPAD